MFPFEPGVDHGDVKPCINWIRISVTPPPFAFPVRFQLATSSESWQLIFMRHSRDDPDLGTDRKKWFHLAQMHAVCAVKVQRRKTENRKIGVTVTEKETNIYSTILI